MSSPELIVTLARLISSLIHIYIFIIIVRSFMSWMGPSADNAFFSFIRRITDPLFRLCHRYLPFLVVGGLDISPIVIIIVLNIFEHFLTRFLLSLAFQG